MKLVFLCTFPFLFLFFNSLSQTHVSGHITTNTNWDLSGSPYFFDGPVVVDSLSTLNIEPGVVLRVNSLSTEADGFLIEGYNTLTVKGNLNCVGTSTSPIIIDKIIILGKHWKSLVVNNIHLEFIIYNSYIPLFPHNFPVCEIRTSKFILKNSQINNFNMGKAHIITNDLLAEKNLFLNGDIKFLGSGQHKLINNMFNKGVITLNGSADLHFNSFLDTTNINLIVGLSSYSDGSNNYWNTNSENTIKSMIDFYSSVKYIPFLDSHHPLTPVVAKFEADEFLGVDSLVVNFLDQSEGYDISSWHWDFGDGETSNFKSVKHVYKGAGNYTVKLTVSNGVYTHYTIKKAYINILPKIPKVGFTQNAKEICPNGSITFSDTTEYSAERKWYFPGSGSPYSELPNPVVIYNSPGTYSVKLVIKSLKSEDGKYIFPYSDSIIKTSWINVRQIVSNVKPSICLVSVNDSGQNVIKWKKLASNVIDLNLIYRESIKQNSVYELIGSFPFSLKSSFKDTLSNVNIRSNKYKIAYKDSCGNISYLSVEHKSIHLNVNKGIGETYNLVWENYEGSNIIGYEVYRGSSNSNMKIIGTNGSNTFYSDINPPLGNVCYFVQAVLQQPCGIQDSAYVISRSNVVCDKTTGVDINKLSEEFFISAHPAKDLLKIEYRLLNYPEGIISSIEGGIISKFKLKESGDCVSIKDLPRGYYILQITDGKHLLTRKFLRI